MKVVPRDFKVNPIVSQVKVVCGVVDLKNLRLF